MKLLCKIFAILELSLILPVGLALANTTSALQTSKTSYVPRLYLTGAGGYQGWTGQGQADLLMPVFAKYDRALFFYGQGRYGYDADNANSTYVNANTWTGSVGMGYRQIVGDSAILGFYVLGDYTKTTLGHSAMIASPGFEVLGRDWDFRMNGYVPVGGTTKSSVTDWADKFGDNSYVILKGHTRYDAKFTYYEETGIGGDAELGRKLFTIDDTLFKLYGNGYFYKMQHNDNVMGGGARLTIEPTNYLKFFVKDSYDNYQKNVAVGGLQVDVNNLIANRDAVNPNDLESRLFSPIERDAGAIAGGSNARETGGPNDSKSRPVIDKPVVPPVPPHHHDGPTPTPTPTPPSPYVEDDDAWYFASNGAFLGDKRHEGDQGTVEDPYTHLDKAALQAITAYNLKHGYSKADIYVKGEGDHYNLGTSPLLIPKNFTIYGVQSDFITTPESADRPIFDGGLSLSSGDILNDISVQHNAAGPTTGVTIDNNSGLVILNDDAITGFAQGVKLTGGSLIIADSKITANAADDIAYGVNVNGADNLIIDGSKIDVTSDNGIGLDATGLKQGTISNSDFSGSMLGAIGIQLKQSGTIKPIVMDGISVGRGDGVSDFATGIDLSNSKAIMEGASQINAYNWSGDASGIILDNSTLKDNGSTIDAVSQGGDAYGVDMVNSTLSTTGTTIDSSAYEGGDVYGINMDGSTLNAAASTIYSISTKGDAYGIKVADGGTLNVDNSKINVTAEEGVVRGIDVDGSAKAVDDLNLTKTDVAVSSGGIGLIATNLTKGSITYSTFISKGSYATGDTGIDLINSGSQATPITADGVVIGTGDKLGNFVTGISLSGSNLDLHQSYIYATSSAAAYGIKMDHSTLTDTGGTIDVLGKDGPNTNKAGVVGIEMDNGSVATISNAVMNVSGNFGAVGVLVNQGSNLTTSTNEINVTAKGRSPSFDSTGILVLNSTANIESGTTIAVNGDNVPVYGIEANGANAILNFNGNGIDITANSTAGATGLYLAAPISSINFNSVSDSAISGSAYGILTPNTNAYNQPWRKNVAMYFDVTGGIAPFGYN